MKFDFDYVSSDSPYVELIWRTRSEHDSLSSFVSPASSQVEIVVTKQKDVIRLSVRGPETKASTAPIPQEAEFIGILFKLGTFLPWLPTTELVDGGLHLPQASSQSFWLQGSAWQFPSFDNADVFISRLLRQGLLAHEPIVTSTLKGQTDDLSIRTVQRRFLRATGLSHKSIYQIERARYAMTLLEQGLSILDTVERAGYYDQPDMTRALKHLIGQTPSQIVDSRNYE